MFFRRSSRPARPLFRATVPGIDHNGPQPAGRRKLQQRRRFLRRRRRRRGLTWFRCRSGHVDHDPNGATIAWQVGGLERREPRTQLDDNRRVPFDATF